MDQIKIGKFIAECRKKNKLTQMQLAEKLNITDRAVSKWENGKTMPDSSIMLELCEVLQISVNDLLNGEMVSPEEYNKKTQAQLLEMLSQKEETDKRHRKWADVLILMGCFNYVFTLVILGYTDLSDFWYFTAMIVVGALYVGFALFASRIQRWAGYLQCKNCGHTYVVGVRNTFFSTPWGKKVYNRCPGCKKYCAHQWTSHKE